MYYHFFCKKKFRKGNEEVVICMHMVDKLIKILIVGY